MHRYVRRDANTIEARIQTSQKSDLDWWIPTAVKILSKTIEMVASHKNMVESRKYLPFVPALYQKVDLTLRYLMLGFILRKAKAGQLSLEDRKMTIECRRVFIEYKIRNRVTVVFLRQDLATTK